MEQGGISTMDARGGQKLCGREIPWGRNMPRPWRHEKMVFDAALIGKFMMRAYTRDTHGDKRS